MSALALTLLVAACLGNARGDLATTHAVVQTDHANRVVGQATSPGAAVCEPEVDAFRNPNERPSYTGVTTNDFCRDPYNTICGTLNQTESAARESRIEPFRRRIKTKALRAVAKTLGRDPATFTEATIADMPFLQRTAATYELNKQLYAAMHEETTGYQQSAVSDSEATVRRAMNAAIDRQFPNTGGFAGGVVNAQLKARLDGTQIITSLTAEVRKVFGDDSLAKAMRKNCGSDGMADNAFAISGATGRAVILCPGLVVGASSTDAQGNLANVLQTLGHELGHHIDANVMPSAYEQYSSCLVSHHSSALKKSADDAGSQVSPTALVQNHIGEISADFWGTQATVEYIRAASPPMGMQRKLALLRESWAGLCGTDDEGTHPSGQYRIENLLRRDPEVHRLMSCPAPDASPTTLPSGVTRFPRPGCTLKGATSNDLF